MGSQSLVQDLVASVHERFADERSGEILRGIPALEDVDRNPMINAGALVAASLVAGEGPAEQVERMSRVFSAYAGRELTLEEGIFASQVESGHRNRAIGHMLREFGILERDPDLAHEVYLRACSTMVTCRDLSLMGATWANGGTNPLTGEEVLSTELTERVLSVMATCGMYDAAGELEFLVADVRRITDVADVSRRLLLDLREFLRERGCEAFLVDPDGLLSEGPGVDGDRPPTVFPSIAAATVHFEDELLRRYGERPPEEQEFEFTANPALDGVPSEVVDELRRRLEPHSFADGELIVAEGDAEAGVFLIMRGRVRSSMTTASGTTRSLATLTPGTCFGDVYVVTGNAHPLNMHADGPVDALELTREEFDRIGRESPELRAAILNIFMFAIHDDVDRVLRTLATGRLAVR